MRSPIAGCERISSHSSSVSGVGLVEDVVGDPDLADVVEQGHDLDLVDLLETQAEPGRDGDREVLDDVRVRAGVPVTGGERHRERADDGAVGNRGALGVLTNGIERERERPLTLAEAVRSVERVGARADLRMSAIHSLLYR